MALLTVNNLEVSFRTSGDEGKVQALKGIDFHVNAGEVLAIVGESGSGKSVTSLAIMGLLAENAMIEQGKITFQSERGEMSLLELSPAKRKAMQGNDIAMIFQEPMTSLNPVLTVGDQLTEPMIVHHGDNKESALAKAKTLLNQVHITEPERILGSYPGALSGGMRQRIMIAMALACQAKLLIADERTTALDVTVQAKILEILAELQKDKGMGMIFITHDMGVVAEIADRVVVMNKGEVVETGDVYDVFANPQEDYTKALIASVPKFGEMRDKAWPQKFTLFGETANDTPHQTAAYDKDPILEAKNLSTHFTVKKSFFGKPLSEVRATQAVDLQLWPGETLAIVGESGCGKSTTGRSILRLNDIQKGEIYLKNDMIQNLSDALFKPYRKSIQMVFQDPYASLNPRLKVGFAIAEPLLTHRKVASLKEATPMVAELLEQVGLDKSHANRYPHEFSGGQRQRIAIARALAIKPDVIIADEAVSALDVSIQAQVINLMMDLQEKYGIAWLFISHDMAVVERIANRVVVMYLGKIAEIGTRQQIFTNPQHPYTKRLLASVPIADPRQRRKRDLADIEIPTVIQAVDAPLVSINYLEVTNGHLVAEDNFGIA